jgi:hypothetical protein
MTGSPSALQSYPSVASKNPFTMLVMLNTINNVLTYVFQLLEDLSLKIWYQHDGTACHNARIVRSYLNANCPARWIRRNGPVVCPVRSNSVEGLLLSVV